VTEFCRVALSTGITLNVALAGPADAPALILLHGFPESHRTWREVAPRLDQRFRLIMPDQRGFAGSDRPQEVEAYNSETLTDDIFALADKLALESFALTGHDWGGVLAWGAATRGDPRLRKLAIINAPHPVLFQKSLIENSEQRSASQYITALRTPGFEKAVEAAGLDALFDKAIAAHAGKARILETEKQQYLTEWAQPGALTAMLNWYRAAKVMVPPPGITVPLPEWLLKSFPKVRIPTLVIWGMKDSALLPVQLEGLDRLIEDLHITRLPDAGHFAPWEAPGQVADALEAFLA
jgi:pimeloyl-ACP methyl ester carboxylesterase